MDELREGRKNKWLSVTTCYWGTRRTNARRIITYDILVYNVYTYFIFHMGVHHDGTRQIQIGPLIRAIERSSGACGWLLLLRAYARGAQQLRRSLNVLHTTEWCDISDFYRLPGAKESQRTLRARRRQRRRWRPKLEWFIKPRQIVEGASVAAGW